MNPHKSFSYKCKLQVYELTRRKVKMRIRSLYGNSYLKKIKVYFRTESRLYEENKWKYESCKRERTMKWDEMRWRKKEKLEFTTKRKKVVENELKAKKQKQYYMLTKGVQIKWQKRFMENTRVGIKY